MSVIETPASATYTCPRCRWSGDFDSRFVTWCLDCGEGADPGEALRLEKEAKLSRGARRRREAARSRAEKLCFRLIGAADLRPPGGPVRLLCHTAAILTHLIGFAVLAASLLLLSKVGSNPIGWVVGLLGVGIAWVVRPRIGGWPKDTKWLGRADLPAFFAVLDRAAAALDAPVPDAVVFNDSYNAGTARRGLRHRPVLCIGVPLFAVLTGPERVALLGHELGHQVNGDATRGVLVRSADSSLGMWKMLFRPAALPGKTRVRRINRYGDVVSDALEATPLTTVIGSIAASVAMFPIYLSVLLLRRLLGWMSVNVGLRAEYLADDMGARLASTEAALGLMQKLSLGPSVFGFIARVKAGRTAAARATAPGEVPKATPQEGLRLWSDLDDYVASMPEHELLRHVRISEGLGTATDVVHPATHLRRRFLTERPRHEAALDITDEEWLAVQRELAPLEAAMGVRLLR